MILLKTEITEHSPALFFHEIHGGQLCWPGNQGTMDLISYYQIYSTLLLGH